MKVHKVSKVLLKICGSRKAIRDIYKNYGQTPIESKKCVNIPCI